jgi:hypothetical protein
MSDRLSNKLIVRSFRLSDKDNILELEKAFGKLCWTDVEAFLGPSRFVSVLEDQGKIVAYQVTYQLGSGEWRSKVLMTKGYDGKYYFEYLMRPTFLKYGADLWIDAIKIREIKNDKSVYDTRPSSKSVQKDADGFCDTEPNGYR